MSHDLFVSLFIVTFYDLPLTLNLLSMTFVLTQYHSQIFTSTLCELELFAARLTDPRAQMVKTMSFTFDLTLILPVTLFLNVKHGLGVAWQAPSNAARLSRFDA